MECAGSRVCAADPRVMTWQHQKDIWIGYAAGSPRVTEDHAEAVSTYLQGARSRAYLQRHDPTACACVQSHYSLGSGLPKPML